MSRKYEARNNCILGAALSIWSVDTASAELQAIVGYMRRYGEASTHRSPRYQQAKAFIEFLTTYEV